MAAGNGVVARTMHNKLLFTVAYSASAFMATAIAQPVANATTDKANAFVVAAEQAYVAHLQAERTGDVALYKRTRAKGAVDETLANLRKQGKSEADLGPLIQRSSKYSVALDGFRFLKAEGSGSVGRLLYRKDGRDNGIDSVEFFGYVVRLEEGSWKVDCAINATGTKMGMGATGKLEERTVDEIRNHRCLALK